MAHVWLCRLHGTNGFSQSFVVKTLKPNCRSSEYVSMFVDEARIGARFDHPNLTRVVELGDLNGWPFLVQEFVDGPNLHQILMRQAMRGHVDAPFACQVAADVAGALYAANHITDEDGRWLNVVHRDVSLANILVSRGGVPKLVDFGIARFEGRETETQVGQLKGKIRYMAPEVVQRGLVSPQSDLYSLGMCLLTAVMPSSMRRGSPVPEVKDSGLEPGLARIIETCLHPDPGARYASGLELKEALEGWLEDHGGRLGPGALGARVNQLFPLGPTEWRSEELTVALTRAELSSEFGTVAPKSDPRWRLFAIVGLLLAGSAALGCSALLVGWQLASRFAGDPPAVIQELSGLDRAEQALADGRIEDAASILHQLATEPLEDGDRARLAELNGRLTRTRVDRIREVARTDPDTALHLARDLASSGPADPELALLIDELAALAKRSPVVANPAPSPVRPHPVAPKPAADPGDELFGERTGRPPPAP